ncbi:hypothetical protein FAI41_08460 [Acetobacteraceae bacterium]|nr:hypothetical protein FAI41_08460 [Acetobacteraceae bacterium]
MDQHDFDQENFPHHDYEGEEHEYSRAPLSGETEENSNFWERLGLTDRSAVWRMLGAIFVVIALLILGLTVWRFVSSSKKDLIPVISPPAGPVRERPADPGGLQIMSDDFGGIEDEKGKDVRLAPPPEAPDRHLLEEQHEAAERHRIEEEKRLALEKERQAKAEEAAKAQVQEAQKNLQERKRHEQEEAKHQKQEAVQAHAQAQAEKVKKEDQAIAGALDLDSRISNLAAQNKESSLPSSESMGGGHWQVQFAAYSSKADATAKWAEFVRKDSDDFQGHRPLITETLKNGHLYIRLRTDGFRSAADAKRFCQAVTESTIPCTPIG